LIQPSEWLYIEVFNQIAQIGFSLFGFGIRRDFSILKKVDPILKAFKLIIMIIIWRYRQTELCADEHNLIIADISSVTLTCHLTSRCRIFVLIYWCIALNENERIFI